MLGDQIGAVYATQLVTLPGTQVVTQTLTTTQTSIQTIPGVDGQLIRVQVTRTVPTGTSTTVVPTLVTTPAQVPILSRGAFKIAENEKPAPEDRFILSYNGYPKSPAPCRPTPGPVFSHRPRARARHDDYTANRPARGRPSRSWSPRTW